MEEHALGVQQDTLLDEEDTDDLLDLGAIDFDLFEDGHTAVARETDLLEEVVVEVRVDGEHEHF
jgi:hypothetical protein